MKHLIFAVSGLILIIVLIPFYKYLTSYIQMSAWLDAFNNHTKKQRNKQSNGETTKETKIQQEAN